MYINITFSDICHIGARICAYTRIRKFVCVCVLKRMQAIFVNM